MMIYDGLTEMRKAGMNSTSFVFVNMMSPSFLIQLIMNKHVCNVSGKLIHENLWGRRAGPLSVRRGAEIT